MLNIKSAKRLLTYIWELILVNIKAFYIHMSSHTATTKTGFETAAMKLRSVAKFHTTYSMLLRRESIELHNLMLTLEYQKVQNAKTIS